MSTERLEQITAEAASEITERLMAQALAAGFDIDMDKVSHFILHTIYYPFYYQVASEAYDGIVNESLGVQDVPSRHHNEGISKPNFQSEEEVSSYSETEQESEFPISDWEYGKFYG